MRFFFRGKLEVPRNVGRQRCDRAEFINEARC
jgi:hypothetical protein